MLWSELVLQWSLSPAWANWMDEREGLLCVHCQSNARSRHLARAIVTVLNRCPGQTPANSLADLCAQPDWADWVVGEFNAAGHLHRFLSALPGLRYSEYGSTDPRIPSEDLLELSYPDATFDLVLNSDVLEHVPDVKKALSEIRRVIKPGGLFIFTVPVNWSQAASRVRARRTPEGLVHLLPPSYHGDAGEGRSDYLVFTEFGRDLVPLCESVGFELELMGDARNPALVTLVARPVPSSG